MYVLWRTDQKHGFVAKPGSPHSYTPFLQDAQTFKTAEGAGKWKCSNERVLSIEEAMHGGYR